MTTSSQALVTNLLVEKFQGLNLTVNVNGTATPVDVYDGPEGPDNEDNFILVMGWPESGDDTSTSTERWAYLGTATRYEQYDLAIVINCFVGGDDSFAATPASGSDAQAAVRTNAESIQSAVEAACLADINLSVQNGGTAPIIYGYITGSRFSQAVPDDGAMGRYAQYGLRYHVYNVLWTA